MAGSPAMSSVPHPVRHAALRTRPGPIVCFFVCVVACLLVFVAAEMEVMSGVRAYVAGEGSWSKSQKDAVHHLRRYALSHSGADYGRFLAALSVPLGDHDARLELARPSPDMARVEAGFVAGRNHPDDLPIMVTLFRRLGRMPYMAEAIAAWTEADPSILRLRRLGDLLRAELASPTPRARRLDGILEKVSAINERLTPLEDRFSNVLGEGARWIKRLLLIAIVGAAWLLLACGTLLSLILVDRARESEARYRALFDNANDLVYSHDLAGNILEVNGACERVTGYGRAAARRMNIAQIVAPDHLARVREMIARKLAGGGATVYELDVVTRDGRRVPLEVSTRIVSAGGRPIGVQGIARDISDRRRSEEAQARLMAELERSSRVKSEFVSTMSHELRTPLNVIIGYAEMAQDTGAPLDSGECVERIEAAARDLLGLIEGTLEMGRIESQRDQPRLETVDLGVFWAAMGASCARLPRRPQVALEWSGELGTASTVTDPRKLSIIVRNLVGNALKFTEKGWVRVGASLEANGVVVRVADSGIGIRPEDQETIFEMFRQADGSDARCFGGSGLGLYIVRRFVAQLGGTIALASTIGQGSLFTVTLPRRLVATSEAA